jgi:hypothetical protein
MNLEDLTKYLIWIVFFTLALGGVYLLLKRFEVMA